MVGSDDFHQLLALHVFLCSFVSQLRIGQETLLDERFDSLVRLKQIDQIVNLDALSLFLGPSVLGHFEIGLLSVGDLRCLLISLAIGRNNVFCALRFLENLIDHVVQIFHFCKRSYIFLLLKSYFYYKKNK